MDKMNSSNDVLKGQVAIITGVSSGLGRATALALAQAGARVALVARRQDELVGLATEIESYGGGALVLPLDLAQGNEIMTISQRTVKAFGRTTCLSMRLAQMCPVQW